MAAGRSGAITPQSFNKREKHGEDYNVNEFYNDIKIQPVIEKGIPIPARGKNKELLSKLEIGDSVYFSDTAKSVTSKFHLVAKRLGIGVAVRKEGEGCRMWRFK